MSRQREYVPPSRRKPQARNTRVKPSSRQPLPGWMWMVGGILIGALITAIINVGGGDKDAELGAEIAASEVMEATSGDDTRSSSSHKPRFDFYTLLKENEVLVPDEDGNLPVSKAEVIAEQQTPPEEQPKPQPADVVATTPKQEAPAPTPRQEQKPATPPQQETTKAIAPDPVKEAAPIVVQAPPPMPDAAPAPQPAKAPEPPAPAPAPAPAKSEVYLLQAGSFRSAADADNVRASLLLLNMHASIEKVTTGPNEVWHRVIVGPFSNTSDLGNARALLSQNGIDSIQVKKQR